MTAFALAGVLFGSTSMKSGSTATDGPTEIKISIAKIIEIQVLTIAPSYFVLKISGNHCQVTSNRIQQSRPNGYGVELYLLYGKIDLNQIQL